MSITDLNIQNVINNKGIITTLLGGLGNQMFEIAAGYVLSKKYNKAFYIGKLKCKMRNINKHNFNNNNYNNTIFKYFFSDNTNNTKSVIINKYNILKNNNYLFFSRKSTFGNVKFPKEINDKGLIISGRFQNYNIFRQYESEIRYLFIQGLQNNIINMKIKYNTEGKAFLHVRRGDYLECQFLFKQPTINYYKRCVNRLKKKNKNVKRIFIFTNDIKYVRSIKFFRNSIFRIIDEKDELNTLALMTLCKEGAIIANSTFGWWGAFLGAHEPRNPVFAFKRWIQTVSTPHLCPKSWIRV